MSTRIFNTLMYRFMSPQMCLLCCLEVARQILGPFLTDANCHRDICPEIKISTTQDSVITLNKYLARK